MPAKLQLSSEYKEWLISLFHTNMGTKEITKHTKHDHYKVIRPLWVERFGEKGLKERCTRLNRLHKLGSNNPMYGKKGTNHHAYKDKLKDTFGYILIQIPSWYKGKEIKTGKTFEHLINYCFSNNLVSVPKGFIVHHIDEDKTNNMPNNLIMLSISEHMKLHNNFKKGATTIP